VLSSVAVALLGIQTPAQAVTPSADSTAPSSTIRVEHTCAAAKPGEFSCFAERRTDIKAVKRLAQTATPNGYGPADLWSAYNLPSDGGAGQTIAIVDADDDPTAEADLAVYRKQYGLPDCTTANGCFSKVDQRGGTHYPTPDPSWAGEIALDLDMVSAIAPNAHILLVEADSPGIDDLGAGVDEAVALGAKYVSNSYGSAYSSDPGSGEVGEELSWDAHYDHPGVAVVASSGDFAYGVTYPAASSHVTAVGGTSLVRDSSAQRGWKESVWKGNDGSGAGSGCSVYEPKPAFQTDSGCANRTVADVSAVADPATGVAVYQTYGGGGWAVFGGTSVSSPIIAGVYADAGTPTAGSYPNAYPYAATTAINDVTTGNNGTCSPDYLCTAGPGYDGPTGLGTPNGLTAFRTGPHGQITGKVTDGTTGAAVSRALVTAGSASAYTRADGTYTLVAPAGHYDITVAAYGYASRTVTGVDLADGANLTEDVVLTAVPSVTVSGKVVDGSGHGWPLYATVSALGVPGAPTWTDPVTGAFSLKLPQNASYKLRVNPAYTGYQTATKTIEVGTTPLSVEVPSTVDVWDADADGYQLKETGRTEPFDSTSTPDGWSVVNADGTTHGWEFDDPGSYGNTTGGSGGFATARTDVYGYEQQDTYLTSPAYDLSDASNPELTFDTDVATINADAVSAQVSDDGGQNWHTIWSSAFTNGKIVLPLTGYAGKPAVQVRFHFNTTFGSWALDNVFVGQRDFAPVPGGLVTGTVTDANTGRGLVGSTVTADGSSTVRASTAATPDDPGLGDGFYHLFSPAGSVKLTAEKWRYGTLDKAVEVGADTVVNTPFVLQAGQISTTASISSSVAWGGRSTQNLKITNTGGLPASVTLGEHPDGMTTATVKGAPLQLVKGTFSPLPSVTKRDTSGSTVAPQDGTGSGVWESAPNLPVNSASGSVDSYRGKIYSALGYGGNGKDSSALYVLDPVAGTWTELAGATDAREGAAHGFINGKLYITGGTGPGGGNDPKLEIYNTTTNTWSTGSSTDPDPRFSAGSAVLNGKLYTVGGCSGFACGMTDVEAYDPAAGSWTQLAAYPEPTSWESCAGIQGELYCAGGTSSQGGASRHAYKFDPSANTWSKIADLPIPLWGSAYAAANGQLVMSTGVTESLGAQEATNQSFAYDPSSNSWTALANADQAGAKAGGALGFYKVGGELGNGTLTPAVQRLAGYDQEEPVDVTWMSTGAQKFTLQPGQSTTVAVTLNASVPEVSQPGVYTAYLSVGADTPYVTGKVPVALTVAPPKTWGKVSGTVLGTTDTGGTAPISGATVELDSSSSQYTLFTDANGGYGLWLDAGNSPLTAIVAKDGYKPVTLKVRFQKGRATVTNVTLTKL
jgi:N-acetylneuraminic acid mutarotase